MITESSIATTPKSTKKQKTANASSSTCTAWATSRTSTRFAFCRPVTSASAWRSVPSSTSRRAVGARGVSAVTSRKVSTEMSSSNWSSSSSSRTTRKPAAARPKNSTAPQMTPPSIAEVTCQTSVLMNRNVTKMQQHRQRSGGEREEQPEAGEGPLERPAGDVVHPQREQGVRRRHADHAPRRRRRTRTIPSRWPARPPSPAARPASSATDHHQHEPRTDSRRADLGAHVVDEVGQAVLEEPGLRAAERRRSSGSATQAASSSRARATSSFIWATSSSTESKRTMPRSRSTNSTSTSTS